MICTLGMTCTLLSTQLYVVPGLDAVADGCWD